MWDGVRCSALGIGNDCDWDCCVGARCARISECSGLREGGRVSMTMRMRWRGMGWLGCSNPHNHSSFVSLNCCGSIEPAMYGSVHRDKMGLSEIWGLGLRELLRHRHRHRRPRLPGAGSSVASDRRWASSSASYCPCQPRLRHIVHVPCPGHPFASPVHVTQASMTCLIQAMAHFYNIVEWKFYRLWKFL